MGEGTHDVFYVYDTFIVLLINNNYIVGHSYKHMITLAAPNAHPHTQSR